MENTTQNIDYLPIPKIDEWMKFQDEFKLLKTQLESSKKQLEKYTNNDRHKRYYEKNKERVKENAKNYLNRLKEENPEKLKEYRHKAYMKRKMSKEN
jgi:sugar-specific transcriptional regulator TrmB